MTATSRLIVNHDTPVVDVQLTSITGAVPTSMALTALALDGVSVLGDVIEPTASPQLCTNPSPGLVNTGGTSVTGMTTTLVVGD